ncbi:polysaccharide deacetylase family protein [Paenibacillus fonticola]|uniref:polysaccharide deacetylase family protein n=1 Tax=Paenibacillus fonticola TaxID=379896 RepID=UPI000374E3AA|nr:polysaccharide deacetylase family protein [Paenibacillus fonticola]
MSVHVYQMKLLELHSVHRESNRSHLRLKLISDQVTELLWNIDEETAESLESIMESERIYKYRLSFHSSWNSAQNQYVSFLTKTYRDQSEKVYFPCSEAYVSGLNSIKSNEPVSQIQTQASLPEAWTSHLALVTQQERASRGSRLLTWTVIAFMSIILTILSGSSMPAFISKTASGEDRDIQVTESQINRTMGGYVDGYRAVTVSAQLKSASDSELGIPLNERLVTLKEPVKPVLPSIALEDTVTFSLPGGKAALTFDDGPSKYTKEITDILMEYQVGGTFFFIGKNVKKYPESVQYAKSSGYAIGSHSMNHLELTKLSDDKLKYEILQSNKLIEEIIQEQVTLFRPPYGAKNDSIIDILRGMNHKMVLWDIDTKDWESRDAGKIYNSVAKADVDGSIILLHESQATIDALPQIIQFLKKQNLEIVNLQ